MDDYWIWTEKWLTEIYRTLKDDGRVAINIPLEVNVQDRGGRVFFCFRVLSDNEKNWV
jgi:DNA modification methylase